MIPVDDLDQLLEARFRERARRVDPLDEPGPIIQARSRQLAARRRHRQIGAVAVVGLAVAALAALGWRGSSGTTHIQTADDVTTTTVAGCSVADVCQPAAVSSMTVGAVPAGYTLLSSATPPPVAGSTVVQLTYGPAGQTSGSPAINTQVLLIQATTSSASGTSGAMAQSDTWTPVTIGARAGRFTTAVHQAGSKVITESDLAVQLSPTVELYLSGEGLDQSQLIDVAASITVQP